MWPQKKDLRIYPALFFHDEDAVCVEFPDLPGCVTFGETMEEALDSAKEALEGFLYCMEQDGDSYSSPHPIRTSRCRKGGSSRGYFRTNGHRSRRGGK